MITRAEVGVIIYPGAGGSDCCGDEHQGGLHRDGDAALPRSGPGRSPVFRSPMTALATVVARSSLPYRQTALQNGRWGGGYASLRVRERGGQLPDPRPSCCPGTGVGCLVPGRGEALREGLEVLDFYFVFVRHHLDGSEFDSLEFGPWFVGRPVDHRFRCGVALSGSAAFTGHDAPCVREGRTCRHTKRSCHASGRVGLPYPGGHGGEPAARATRRCGWLQ